MPYPSSSPPYPRGIQRQDHGQASQPGQASDAPSPPDGASDPANTLDLGRPALHWHGQCSFPTTRGRYGDTTDLLLYSAKTLNFKGDRDRRIYGSGASIALCFWSPSRPGPWRPRASNVSVFKAITVVQFAGVLWCLVALFRVSTGHQALAACLALSCFVGLHTSGILFGFFPLSHHSLTLLGLLATAVLCLSAYRSWYPACYFAICLVLPLAPRDGIAAAADVGVPVVGRRARRAAPRRRLGSGRGGALRCRAHDVQLGWHRRSLGSTTDSGLGFGHIEPGRVNRTRSARRHICSGPITSWRA